MCTNEKNNELNSKNIDIKIENNKEIYVGNNVNLKGTYNNNIDNSNEKSKELYSKYIDSKKEILRLKDVQFLFGLSKTGAYKLIKKRKFSSLICGNKMFISAEDVFEFYNQKFTSGEEI